MADGTQRSRAQALRISETDIGQRLSDCQLLCAARPWFTLTDATAKVVAVEKRRNWHDSAFDFEIPGYCSISLSDGVCGPSTDIFA
jgi:hypothetical protein